MRDRDTTIAGDVSRSVVVTGDGNIVHLTFGEGGIVLRLERRHVRRPDRRRPVWAGEPARELDLLDPERGMLPFVGRADMMGVLRGWAESEADVSVLAVTGGAGSGKTRLALALCEALDPEGGSEAWRAGFLSGSSLAAVVEALATRTFDWAGDLRLLVVVDNAAQCHRAMAGWLDWLVHERLGEARLRVLLLEREAPEGFGWWHDLAEGAGRGELFHALRPVGLPELADVEERRALLGAALAGAARVRGVRVAGGVPAAGEQPGVDRALAGAQFGSPLNLVMAGVLAMDQGLGAALALRRLDAAQRLGAREMKRFGDIAAASGVGVDAMRHAVGFNALAGGLAVDGLPGVLAREMAAAHLPAGDAAGLASLLEQELPPRRVSGGEARLGGVRPDLVAEAVTIAAFSGEAWRAAEGAKALGRAYAIEPERAAAALMRLLQDFGYAMEDPGASKLERAVGQRVMGWLEALVDGVADVEVLGPLAEAFPAQSLVLREAAARVQGRLAVAYRCRAAHSGTVNDVVAAAGALHILANRLSDLGDKEAALQAAQEAVKLRRTLAAAWPDAFAPDLAGSLSNLANRLRDLGRLETALEAAQEAVTLHRLAVSKRPDVFTPNLARSLNNLALTLSDLGRRDAALEAAREAVDLRRSLAVAQPDAFTPALAKSLSNLGNMLSDLGHQRTAFEATQEATELYRTLAAIRPDAFTPELSALLSDLSNRLSHLGRREAALKAGEEATDLCRSLAVARPEVFTPSLAASLSNMSHKLSDLGDWKAAAKAAKEAVDLFRALAAARPDVFRPGLARSLNNSANMLCRLGHREKALEAAREAVALLRVLAGARPDAFIPDLAMSLNNFANMLSDLGHWDKALEAAREAVALLRVLTGARPNTFIPDLAMSLNNFASRLSELGFREEALKTAQEAVDLYRALVATLPDTFRPDLAGSLGNLANRLGDFGDREAALKVAREAVDLYHALAAARPEAFTPNLAASLNNLAMILGVLGFRQAALDAAQEAVKLRRALAAARPDAFTPDLASSLHVLGNLLAEDGRVEGALDVIREAIAVLTPHARAHQAVFNKRLSGIVGSYVARCREAGVEPNGALLDLLPASSFNTGGDAMSDYGNNRTVSVQGGVHGSVFQVGDGNAGTLTQVQPPAAREVDVVAEIAGLRALMEGLAVPERGKLVRALEDAGEEAAKAKPDKEDMAGALERAVKVSKGAADFAENADKIRERVVRIAGWVGPLANGALALFGLTL